MTMGGSTNELIPGRAESHPTLSSAATAIPPSGIREIVNLALERATAIHLEAGQPNFPVPPHVAEAAQRAIAEGWNYYTPSAGLLTLRELIAEKVARINGYEVSPAHVVCATGGTGAAACAFMATLNPGDEVLVPDPAWPIYEMLLRLVHARPIAYRTPSEDTFEPDMDHLRSLVTARTRMLVVNSPNNPTGAVYGRPTVEKLVSFADRHDLWLLSDECYDQIYFESAPLSPASIEENDRVISVYAFSKTYSMTGWRLGYAVAAPDVALTMIKVQQSIASSTASIVQKAAEAALTGPQDVIVEMVRAYRRRRDDVVSVLDPAGLLVTVPRGAFYILANIAPSGLDSKAFALRLLTEADVAVSPGLAFGNHEPSLVRISLATADDALNTGVSRLVDFVAALSD